MSGPSCSRSLSRAPHDSASAAGAPAEGARARRAQRRGEAGRALGLMLGLVVAVGLIGGATFLMLSPTAVDSSADVVADRDDRDDPDRHLPEMPVTDAVVLPTQPADDDAVVEDTPEIIAELLEQTPYERRDIPGRVIMDDGSAPPPGLMVYARNWRPDPEVRRLSMQTLGDAMGGEDNTWSIERGWELVPRTTRTHVEDDGAFLMKNFPLEGGYLQVETDLVYQLDPVRFSGSEDEFVLLMTRGAAIEGHVRLPDGSPELAATVRGLSELDPYAFLDSGMVVVELDSVLADEEGFYRIAPVPVGTTFKVHADDGSGPFQSEMAVVPELAPGETFSLDFTLRPGGTLSGLVLDEASERVAGVKVHLQPAAIDMTKIDELGRITDDTQKTGLDGSFSFSGLPDGEYLLMLGSADYKIARTEALHVESGDVLSDIVIKAERGATVAGHVFDAMGEPVKKAKVKAALPPSFVSMKANAERGLRPFVEVDEQGHFELRGYEDGGVRIWAQADGYVGAHVDAKAGDTDVVITLLSHTVISGIAMSLTDGEPLQEYKLRASPAGGLFNMGAILEMEERIENRVAPQRVRHPQGKFELVGVAPGTYDLHVTAPGYARASLIDVEVLPDEGVKGLIFMVAEEARITGTVVSLRTGMPVENAEVTTGRIDMMGVWTTALEGGAVSGRTDAEGRFELSGLGDKPVAVAVSHNTHQPLTLEKTALRPGELKDLGLIELSPGAVIWGKVTDDRGMPEAAVNVMAAEATGKSMRRAPTDAQGMYRLEGLGPGTYSVMRMDFSMSMDTDNAASFMEDMVFEQVVLAADEEMRVDLSRSREGGTTLEGSVRSAAGPEADTMMWIVRETGGMATRFGSTDARGDYSFDGLGEGRWLLQVLPSSEAIGGGSQPSSPVAVPVVIGPGPTQHLDVDVPGGVLRGEVVAKQGGDPISGIRVILERTDDGRPSSRFIDAMGGRVGEAWTNGRGEFQFQHLPTATYAVQAGGQNIMGLGEAGWAARRVENVAVTDGSMGLTLEVELEPAGAVTGVVSDTRGRPLGGIPIWARNDATGSWLGNLAEVATDSSGVYMINSLEPGSWTLAFGGETHALTVVGGITITRDREVTRDVTLRDGVEVFVDCGEYDPYDLMPLVLGPEGRLPVHLVSMERLLGGTSTDGKLRVGRIEAGAYELSVLQGSKLIHDAQVTVSGRDKTLTITLGEDD